MARTINVSGWTQQLTAPIFDGSYVGSLRPSGPSGELVTNDAELLAAIADDQISSIILAPGTYSSPDIVAGVRQTSRL